ncbi:MAG: tRNA (adenosine(37)-N6)-threonylcarbamoyltransferase complex dimerization subunit type 1 TsaB [Kineosporiaceae bacterium]
MLLLALDTSSPVVSVALVEVSGDGVDPVAGRDVHDARRPADLLAPAVAAVLSAGGVRPRDLGAVAVGTGPGPFTALRAGVVTARALALALGVPVAGVGSLDALAEAVRERVDRPLVVTDARRRQVYWAAYDAGRRTAGPAVDRPDAVPVAGRPVVGRGAWLYPEVLGAPVDDVLDPPAGAVARLAAADLAAGRPGPVAPQYLRRPDVREPTARKRVTAAGPRPVA